MKMTVDQRYEQGIDHDPKTYKLFKHTRKIDKDNGYVCDFKFGGDGDDGETLMYLFDIYFQEVAQ